MDTKKINEDSICAVLNRINAFSITVEMANYKNMKEYKFHCIIKAVQSSIERKMCHRLEWLTEPGNKLVNENEAVKNVIYTAE